MTKTLTETERSALLTLCVMAAYADGDKDDRERDEVKRIVEGLNRNDAEETTDGHGFTRMELSQVGDGSAKPGHRLVDVLGPPESPVPSVSIGVHPWLNSFPSALIRLNSCFYSCPFVVELRVLQDCCPVRQFQQVVKLGFPVLRCASWRPGVRHCVPLHQVAGRLCPAEIPSQNAVL